MGDITELLVKARAGDPQGVEQVFAALYPELRKLAASRLTRRDATLTPTVLVHELFMRMLPGTLATLQDRRHFFAAAAKAMRWIIVDQARRHGAEKRGGDAIPVTLTERLHGDTPQLEEMLVIDQGLDALERVSPRQREVVELRFFAGLEFEEIAQLQECSVRTAKREWERARAFLYALLDG